MKEPHFTPEVTDDFVQLHEQVLVPVIYSQWSSRVTDIAEIYHGDHILDVACGTGSLARTANLETGLKGRVVGLDVSEKLLESARRTTNKIEWQQGEPENLPFKDNEFDRVICQFSLMFIANRVAAIKEMLRVCKPDGLIVLAIWAPLDHSEAYTALVRLIERHLGFHAANKLASPWALAKPGAIDSILLSAGVNEYECHERVGLARFPSMETFVETHLRLAGEFDKLDEQSYQNLLTAAATELHPFIGPDQQLVAQLDANIFVVKDV